jgi:NAD(P)-dependent dehydrogenase (short-subunit alcohol dehydrogenase family)
MTASLSGRGAVVTGAGRDGGIGAAVARALSEAGATVVAAAHADSDVTDPASVRNLGETARRRLGTVDILINNAGVAGSAPVQKITPLEWERVMAVNATGTFLCIREFLPAMLTHGWGRIVNVASVAGLEGGKYIAHYSAAKHAVIGLTRSVALEVAGTGVTVNAVCPAYVDTPMTQRTLETVQAKTGLARDKALRAVLDSVGQARLLTPDEVAAEILALCRDDALNRNGEAVVLPAGVAA